jgi:hypothetical protein
MLEGLWMTKEVQSPNFEKIAERELLLGDNETDQQVPIVVKLGKPYWIEPGIEAACPIAIDGLLERRKDIRGIDLIQALELALKFAASFLANPPQGKTILWPSGEVFGQPGDENAR